MHIEKIENEEKETNSICQFISSLLSGQLTIFWSGPPQLNSITTKLGSAEL